MSITHRTKRVHIEARQFSGLMTIAEAQELGEWCGGQFTADFAPGQEMKTYYWYIQFPQGDGSGRARPGDWIVRFESGHHQVVDAKVFASTYEPIQEGVSA